MLSLRFRLLLSPVIIVLAAIGTTFLFISVRTSWELQRYVERDAIVATLLAEHNSNPNQHSLQAEVERLGAQSGDRIVLTDRNGRVIADSEQALVGQMITTTVADGSRAPAQGVQSTPIPLSSPSVAPTAQSTSVPAMLPPSTLPLLAYFGSRGSQTFHPSEMVLLQGINQSLLAAALVSTVIGLLLTLTLSHRILTPIETLTAAARQMERGDFSQRVPVTSNDEIGVLTRAFNVMADGLVRLEQLRKNLVNDVAHELRSPLTNIRGYLEAVRDRVTPPTPQLIDSIYDETMLLNRLIDDLQDLAMAEAGQLRLVRQPIVLASRIARVVDGLQPALRDRQIAIEVAVAGDTPMVDADPARLGQVLSNLLNNAIGHTPAGGRIVIRAARQADEAVVSIEDSGTGILPEDLPFIFERFFRADRARARATGGAGLGLTIVKQLVERHGGRIWVNSTPGEGSTFTFTLPAAPQRGTGA